jgi:hypothetical protein
MAIIDAILDQSVISALRGIVDFYCLGDRFVARSWPRYCSRPPTVAQEEAREVYRLVQAFIRHQTLAYADSIKSLLAYGDQTAMDTVKKVLLSASFAGQSLNNIFLPEESFELVNFGARASITCTMLNEPCLEDFDEQTIVVAATAAENLMAWSDEGPRRSILNRGKFTPRAKTINSAIKVAQGKLEIQPITKPGTAPEAQGFGIPHVKKNRCRGKPYINYLDHLCAAAVRTIEDNRREVWIANPPPEVLILPVINFEGRLMLKGAPVRAQVPFTDGALRIGKFQTIGDQPFRFPPRTPRVHRRWPVVAHA